MRELVLKDIRPTCRSWLLPFWLPSCRSPDYLFRRQVCDRAIPAQSYPTLHVPFYRCSGSGVVWFLLRGSAYPHTGPVSANAPICAFSDRVFATHCGCATAPSPRLTGSFIFNCASRNKFARWSPSSTMSTHCRSAVFSFCLSWCWYLSPCRWRGLHLSRPCWWSSPACCFSRRSWLCLQPAAHESTLLRNAVLVESVRGPGRHQADAGGKTALQWQWNSYIRITGESGYARVSWPAGPGLASMSVQSPAYAAIIMFGAPMVIEGRMTTGAVVAASMLGSRMIALMANLCGVLARWQQVKAAKWGLDSMAQLPTETQYDEDRVHQGDFFTAIISLRTHISLPAVMISAFHYGSAPGGHARRTGGDPA